MPCSHVRLIKSGFKVMWGQVWWPILRIGVLHLTHQEHTHTHTHTVNTHPEQWAGICAEPKQLWVRCLAQGHLSHGIEGGEGAVHSLPPTYNSCQTGDSNPQPSGYKSDSLSIRPRLPQRQNKFIEGVLLVCQETRCRSVASFMQEQERLTVNTLELLHLPDLQMSWEVGNTQWSSIYISDRGHR